MAAPPCLAVFSRQAVRPRIGWCTSFPLGDVSLRVVSSQCENKKAAVNVTKIWAVLSVLLMLALATRNP